MTENQCIRCGRPMPDVAYACQSCAYRAGDQLHTIADMTDAARDVAQGRARRGPSSSSSSESRLPLNLGATQRLDAVQGNLGGWARHIAATRGIREPQAETLADDLVAVVALWLAGHVDWMRHRQEAAEFLGDVDIAARIVSGIARGPTEQQYLGPCGAPEQVEVTGLGTAEREYIDGKPCEGDIYAARGSRVGRCRTCRAEVATSEREAWLDGEVRTRAFRASEIANAYRINVNTIRSWAARGQLVPHGHDTDDRPQYNVGDVLDLAAADAARRATEQSKRARRAATKAENEDAA